MFFAHAAHHSSQVSTLPRYADPMPEAQSAPLRASGSSATRALATQWLTRGAVFAVLMVLVRVVQGLAISLWETHGTAINIVLVLVFLAAVTAWAVADGRGDAQRNPDPDRREDLAMWWLLGGIFAGVVSGLVIWLISLFNDGILRREHPCRAHHHRGVRRTAGLCAGHGRCLRGPATGGPQAQGTRRAAAVRYRRVPGGSGRGRRHEVAQGQ